MSQALDALSTAGTGAGPSAGSGVAFYGPPRTTPEGAFPQDGPPEAQLRFLLAYAILAPSVFNSQPWRFVVEGAEARLYADRSRRLPAFDPLGRELTLSCGAALFNLRMAARHFGFDVAVDVLPEGPGADLLARLHLRAPRPALPEERLLFQAIRHRHTVRTPFVEATVPGPVFYGLSLAAEAEGARLVVFTEETQRAALAVLLAEGIRKQAGDPRVTADIEQWLRHTGDPRRDGVPDVVQGKWDRRAGRPIPAEHLAARTAALVAEGPAVLVLATNADDPAAWLAAGQAMERVLLLAAAQGLQASFHNALVEVAPLRARLAHAAGVRYPQAVLRVGYPDEDPGTPRRAVRDVVLS